MRLRGTGDAGTSLGAALWALHPVQVESVAWICELKNTQSAVLFLAAALCYLRWLDARGQPGAGRAYTAALACAALAILSKPSTVMLPVTLALWFAPALVVFQDAGPGVALGASLREAYEQAWATDTESAFGGIIALSETLDADTASVITELFTEVDGLFQSFDWVLDRIDHTMKGANHWPCGIDLFA